MFKTMPKQVQQSPEKKRLVEQTRGSDQYTAMRQMASLMGNQAMLGMMQSQGQYQKEQSPFFNDMRKKFGPKQKPESQARPARQSSGGTSLPDYLWEKFEKKSGLPMDDVRVHYNSDKPAELGALAYTQGTDVHIGPGQEEHLEHELVHVVQQKQGVVQPTEVFRNLPINDSPALESKADTLEIQQVNEYKYSEPVIQCSGKAPPRSQPKVPELLYHGTDSGNISSIKAKGLMPSKNKDITQGHIPRPGATMRASAQQGREIQKSHDLVCVHMTDDLDYAKSYAVGAVGGGVVLVISTKNIRDKLEFEGREWRYRGIISPEDIVDKLSFESTESESSADADWD